MAQFKVNQAGPLVTIQDQGRKGYMRFGVTPSGPMDRLAYHLAHSALGQDETAVIEVSMGGLDITCVDGAVSAVITGGAFNVLLDGKTLPHWASFTLEQGSRLQIRPGPWGSWCYLAFAGVLDVPQWLGSASVQMGSNLCGSPLVANDTITVEKTKTVNDVVGEIMDAGRFKCSNDIRVIMGPQDHYFSDQSKQDLVNQEFHPDSGI